MYEKQQEQKPKQPDDEGIDLFSQQLIDTIENALVKSLPHEAKIQIHKSCVKVLPIISQYAQDASEIVKQKDMAGLANLSDAMMRQISPEVPEVKSAITFASDKIFNIPQPTVKFIQNSRYDEYLSRLNNLVSSAMSRGLKVVLEFLSSLEADVEDIISQSQSLSLETGIITKFLTNNRTRYTRHNALQCIEAYRTLAGTYEISIRFVAGLASINVDAKTSYNTFRANTLASNIKVLEVKGCGLLVEDFDRLIRNSIAHKSYQFEPKIKSVIFRDRVGDRTLNYRQLFHKTRELFCLIMAISQARGILYSQILKNIAGLTGT